MTRELGRASLIGVVLVLPFMILELINRQDLGMEFPFPLFFLMWLFGAAFVLIMTSVVRFSWESRIATRSVTWRLYGIV